MATSCRFGEPDGTVSPRIAGSPRLWGPPVRRAIRERILDEKIWPQSVGNLSFNPISARTCATLDVICAIRHREVARAMMIEAQAIGERLGVALRVDIERRIDGAARVGAAQDPDAGRIRARRAMEIDALVTAVQELGRPRVPTRRSTPFSP